MPMPNRENGKNSYRYAYQGQEKDIETGKEAFQLRLWDSRIGRWLTTDPYRQYNSPYVGMGNDPVNGIDPDGGFRSRFGAWLYKSFHGTGGEIFENDHGTWGIDVADGSYEGGVNIITGSSWEDKRLSGAYNQAQGSFYELKDFQFTKVSWSSPDPIHNSTFKMPPLSIEVISSINASFPLDKIDSFNNRALKLAQNGAIGRLAGDRFSEPALAAAGGAVISEFTIPSLKTITHANGKIHTEIHSYGVKFTRLDFNSGNPFDTTSRTIKYDVRPTTINTYFERENITSKLSGWGY